MRQSRHTWVRVRVWRCAVLTVVELYPCVVISGNAEIDDYLRRSRLVVKCIGTYAALKLREAGAQVALPQGGFYLFVTVPPLAVVSMTSAEMCERLLNEAGVAVLPGSCFGLEPTRHVVGSPADRV